MTAGAMNDTSRVAVPGKRAAQIAGVSERRLRYWADRDVARPSVDVQLTPGKAVRLYEFGDMMSLLVALELQERKVSFFTIRRVVDHLRARGYKDPLTDLEFATVNGQVYFRHPSDGTWEGGDRPDQIVIHEVLNLQRLQERIWQGLQRDPAAAGKTERRRGAMASKELFSGTRVPVATVVRYLAAGRTTEQILGAFPALTPADVDAARAHAVRL